MSDTLLVVSILYCPVIIGAGISFYSANRSRSRRTRTWLRRSAYFWLIALAVIFGFALFAGTACQGNTLYGYADCRFLSSEVANLSATLIIYSFLAAIAFMGLLFLVAVFLELRTHSDT